ncbi:MAG: DUF3373 family protein [Deltaproteobacteria bacterium]|nr:DUF3373 family protein [Deltaproteobacteria bacterium]
MKLKKDLTSKIRKWFTVIILSCFLSAGSALYAQDSSGSDNDSSGGEEYNEVDNKIKTMIEELQNLQKKISELKKYEKKQFKKLSKRIDKTELHAATDKISFGVEFESNVESIHYNDIYAMPDNVYGALLSTHNNQTLSQYQSGGTSFANFLNGMPLNKISSASNDVIFTEKLRLNMKSKFNDKLDFTGRLAAYKVWGDSSGVKFNNGSLGDVYLDGTSSSVPSGDNIHLERAYFNYKFNAGKKVPASLSVGRRPSTDGSPLEFREYSLEGGAPLASAINWQFDGISLNFDLENLFNIPGHVFKLCYGIAFESGWGNSYSLMNIPDVDDVNVFGFIDTIYNDSVTNLTALYARGEGLTDGFTGLTLMPMTVTKDPTTGKYNFAQNSNGWISRVEPQTNIGDYDVFSLLLKTNLKKYFEAEHDIDFFAGASWSHTSPSNISKIPFYEMLGMGLLSSNGNLEDQNGYSFYIGTRLSMPYDGKLGLEYNWGSKYWLSMTTAEDSLVASKLATRGHAYEIYYIQPIFNQNFFAKLGLMYYDYQYTGSGSPLGAPVKIDGMTSLEKLYSTGLSPVIDNALNLYFSLTFRF